MSYWIIVLSLLILAFLRTGTAVECFCTEENSCEVLGRCQGRTCLVGVLKNNHVLRTCGSEQVGCYRNIGRWSEVCACNEPRCNSFHYYRLNMPKDNDEIVFDRRSTGSTSEASLDSSDQTTTQTSLLTILIVAVPLAVGAAMVVVVAFNYYCHLC